MGIELHHSSTTPTIITMEAHGDLSSLNFDDLCHELRTYADVDPHTRLLVEVHELHEASPENGWDASCFVRGNGDLLFSKVAVIGDTRTEPSLASFVQVFALAEVRIFPPEEADNALPWLKEPVIVQG